MTTLTINIPDNNDKIIADIAKIISGTGYELTISNDDGFTENEFATLKESFKEALLIKNGKAKAIPAAELWK